MDSKNELLQTLELLKIEKEEDLDQYKSKVLFSSLQDKRKDGVCWYPVYPKRSYPGTGEKYIIEFERTTDLDQPHLFQSGKLVSIFLNDGSQSSNASAVVNFASASKMVVTLVQDEMPDWLDDGKLGIDLLFDEASYREMESAMKQIIKLEKGRAYELREILLGTKAPDFAQQDSHNYTELNESQNNALRYALSAKDVAVIHGPPGTGKTTTLVTVINEVVKKEKEVLVCAPSNAAVDLLVEKLSERGLYVLRLGHPARVDEAVLKNTLDARISSHPYYKDLKSVRKKSEELRRVAMKYKRHFGQAERAQRKLVLSEAKKMREESDQLEHYIINDILEKVQVYASTLVGSTHNLLNDKIFNTLFIDEAAQALEPAAWIPILKARRVVFAGDHFQLPPTIKSYEAGIKGLQKTLFQKHVERTANASMLTEQYRMHEQIMRFSGEYFYDNKLTANILVKNWQLNESEQPLEFIDTAGCGFFEQTDKETRSTYNKEEAHLLIKHLIELAKRAGITEQEQQNLSIGIIAPYKAQVKFLIEELDKRQELLQLRKLISIDTVDGFQGQERDIMYISLVRSNTTGAIGFLSDTRRMNVSLTRARKKLVVFGDSSTLGAHYFYNQFIDYVNSINAYRSAFEII